MCVGVPMKILSINGIAARATDGREEQLVDLSLVEGARTGDWILTFLGSARDIIPEDEARKIAAALDGLRALMAGGELGDAFADLDNHTPTLPPHLQAALDQGKATG